MIDTAFLIGGEPARWFGHVAGALDWHPAAARFVGAGETRTGALFTYHADWDAPGRWGIRVNTRLRRLILQPMEGLAVQARGSFAIDEVDLEDTPDRRFKPGIWRQARAFLGQEDDTDLLAIGEAARRAREIHARMLCPWSVHGAAPRNVSAAWASDRSPAAAGRPGDEMNEGGSCVRASL